MDESSSRDTEKGYCDCDFYLSFETEEDRREGYAIGIAFFGRVDPRTSVAWFGIALIGGKDADVKVDKKMIGKHGLQL